jgi:integrase
MRTLTAEQADILFEGTKGESLHTLWIVLCTTGLRLGEALGLKWVDVDLNTRCLVVCRALQRQTGKGLVFVEPKTAMSRRTVQLTDFACEALREHRVQQLEYRLTIGPAWRQNDMIFASHLGTPLDPSMVSHRFPKVLDSLNLPRIRVHDLRHTTASLMLREGVHPRVVQEMLGHSTISITLGTYSHVLPTMHREAADKLGELFAHNRNSAHKS